MYFDYFGLRERPFDLSPNPRYLVLTDAHREALSNLEYGISSRRGITLLLGDAGTGKTTLIRAAVQRQPEQVHCVHLQNPALTRGEFLEMLAVRFELGPEARTSKTILLMELESTLRRRHDRGESTVLIVDEAQSVPIELLEEIRLLGNIETDESKLLSIILAGQPELNTTLNRESLRQFKQRIALRCELRSLNAAETAGYIAGRLRTAGGVGSQIFTREAVLLIHERSGGIPRMISVIADNALVTAFALERKPVNRDMIAEVCRDLGLSSQPGRPPSVVRAPAMATTVTSIAAPAAVAAVGAGTAASATLMPMAASAATRSPSVLTMSGGATPPSPGTGRVLTMESARPVPPPPPLNPPPRAADLPKDFDEPSHGHGRRQKPWYYSLFSWVGLR